MSVTLTFLQLALEALLVILLLAIWWRTRAPRPDDPARLPENLKESIEKFMEESEKIAETFQRNLKDKKELSADLILKLDRRLSDYQALLKRTEAGLQAAQKKLAESRQADEQAKNSTAKANPAAPEIRALVLQMAKKGHPPEEIAAKARLHLGEVELIIDLERQFSI